MGIPQSIVIIQCVRFIKHLLYYLYSIIWDAFIINQQLKLYMLWKFFFYCIVWKVVNWWQKKESSNCGEERSNLGQVWSCDVRAPAVAQQSTQFWLRVWIAKQLSRPMNDKQQPIEWRKFQMTWIEISMLS